MMRSPPDEKRPVRRTPGARAAATANTIRSNVTRRSTSVNSLVPPRLKLETDVILTVDDAALDQLLFDATERCIEKSSGLHAAIFASLRSKLRRRAIRKVVA